MAFTIIHKLSKQGLVPPNSEASTEQIPTTGKGRLGVTNDDWNETLDMAQIRHPDLTIDLIKYVIRGMLHGSLPIKLPLMHPTDSEIDDLLPASNKKSIDDVPTSMDDPSTSDVEKNSIHNVPNTKPISK